MLDKNTDVVLTREEHYIDFFTNLTVESLKNADKYFSSDARFKDPFNDVIGIDAIRKVFVHMFSTCESPRFTIINQAIDGDILLINWVFGFIKGNRKWEIEGCSRVSFNAENKVEEHIDYWDPAEQIYAKVGLLKPMMNFLVRRLKA